MKKHVKVFISYVKEDFDSAKKIYEDLKAFGVSPWLDEKNMLPGENKNETKVKAIRESRYFIALLSFNSVTKKGFVQKELKIALDILDEHSVSDIFVIPVCIDNFDNNVILSEKLNNLHPVDLFISYESGIKKIFKAITEKTDDNIFCENNPVRPTKSDPFDNVRSNSYAAPKITLQNYLNEKKTNDKVLIHRNKSKATIFKTILTHTLLVSAAICAMFIFFKSSDKGFSNLLSLRDPILFSHSKTGIYDIARVIPNNKALYNETKFTELIDNTKETFDMFAPSGSVLVNYETSIANALKRGVKFRIILQDPGEKTKHFYKLLHDLTNENHDEIRRNLAISTEESVMKLKQKVNKDRSSYQGTIDLRWTSIPILKYFWLSDAKTDRAILHITIPHYLNRDLQSNFRMSHDGGIIIKQFTEEFEGIWLNQNHAYEKHSLSK